MSTFLTCFIEGQKKKMNLEYLGLYVEFHLWLLLDLPFFTFFIQAIAAKNNNHQEKIVTKISWKVKAVTGKTYSNIKKSIIERTSITLISNTVETS